MEVKKAKALLEGLTVRGAWKNGVKAYALDILEDLEDRGVQNVPENLESVYTYGEGWGAWSWGGSALIYNYDIAHRLCNPTELKITREGARRPNSREDWLDVQARALRQASWLILKLCREF